MANKTVGEHYYKSGTKKSFSLKEVFIFYKYSLHQTKSCETEPRDVKTNKNAFAIRFKKTPPHFYSIPFVNLEKHWQLKEEKNYWP